MREQQLTYGDLIQVQHKLSAVFANKSKETFIIMGDYHYDMYYFNRRYDNIHRLITHCNIIPNRFKSRGVTYVRNTSRIPR